MQGSSSSMSKATLCLRYDHAANQVRRVFLSSPVVSVVFDDKVQGQEGFPYVFSKMDVYSFRAISHLI